jgi:hypothetical protein
MKGRSGAGGARREPWPLDLTTFNAIFYLFSSTDVAVGQLGISELQERILFYHSICYTHISDVAAPTLSRPADWVPKEINDHANRMSFGGALLRRPPERR